MNISYIIILTSIGILYGLDGPKFEPQWEQLIFSSSYPFRLALELFLGGKEARKWRLPPTPI